MSSEHKFDVELNIGEAFPADDRMARYVMRLSMALGDLRTALRFAVRDEQPDFERLYFVRLVAQHLRELAVLFDPPDRAVIPGIEDFIRETIPKGRREERAYLRKLHREVLALLREPFENRPDVTLKSELDRMRHSFAHYHRDAESDVILREAMERAAEIDSGYDVTGSADDMRARYADEVIANLVHPFDIADPNEATSLARELHERLVGLLAGPIAMFLQATEAHYLRAKERQGVVRFNKRG